MYDHQESTDSVLSIADVFYDAQETITSKSKLSPHIMGRHKRYSKIDQHLARHFKYNDGCLSSSPPFLCSQTITPFSYQLSPPIRKDGCNLSQLWNPYTFILVLF